MIRGLTWLNEEVRVRSDEIPNRSEWQDLTGAHRSVPPQWFVSRMRREYHIPGPFQALVRTEEQIWLLVVAI